MVSTWNERQHNKRVFSQLIDFDRDIFLGDTACCEEQDVVVNGGLADREFVFFKNDGLAVADENTVDLQRLERSLTDKIAREKRKFIEKVGKKIQNTFLAAINNIITPRLELTVRSVKASSGRDAASVTTNWERGTSMGHCPFQKRIRQKNNLQWTDYNSWKSRVEPWRSEWIAGPENTLWPAVTHSSDKVQLCFSKNVLFFFSFTKLRYFLSESIAVPFVWFAIISSSFL